MTSPNSHLPHFSCPLSCLKLLTATGLADRANVVPVVMVVIEFFGDKEEDEEGGMEVDDVVEELEG